MVDLWRDVAFFGVRSRGATGDERTNHGAAFPSRLAGRLCRGGRHGDPCGVRRQEQPATAGPVSTAAGTGVATAAAVQATATGMAASARAGTPIGTVGGPAGTPNAPAAPAGEHGRARPYMGKKLNVALVLNGNLGDKSFFDSAQRGMDRAKAELGATVKTIELGTDQNKWQPGLTDAASGPYDLIICGTFDMVKPSERDRADRAEQEVRLLRPERGL